MQTDMLGPILSRGVDACVAPLTVAMLMGTQPELSGMRISSSLSTRDTLVNTCIHVIIMTEASPQATLDLVNSVSSLFM